MTEEGNNTTLKADFNIFDAQEQEEEGNMIQSKRFVIKHRD